MAAPKALIFSAPSGSGKTTIVRHLMQKFPVLGFSVSATTRPKRSHEVNGQDYYFLSIEEFQQKLHGGAFVEYEEVYPGRMYGTLKQELDRLWSLGKVVVFDVDVVGGKALKDYFSEEALAIFVKVKDLTVLEKRLRDRNTEDEANLNMRLAKVEEEWKSEGLFDVTLHNEHLDEALIQAENIVSPFLGQSLS